MATPEHYSLALLLTRWENGTTEQREQVLDVIAQTPISVIRRYEGEAIMADLPWSMVDVIRETSAYGNCRTNHRVLSSSSVDFDPAAAVAEKIRRQVAIAKQINDIPEAA
jgi:hypothetical protein